MDCWMRQRARTDGPGTGGSSRVQEVRPGQSDDISGVPQDAVPVMPLLELDKLPEDILCHIHSLLPLPDAARAACVSQRFLRSWRCFPNLKFNDITFSFNEGTPYASAKNLIDRIDHIIRNHSGIGVKTLKLDVCHCRNVITAQHLDIWLQATIRSGILGISVELPEHFSPQYNFPCSHLSCAASSLQSIHLFSCAFHPTSRIGYLTSLRTVSLNHVHITGEELGCLFSSTVSLRLIQLTCCNEITFLNIPSHLQALRTLMVFTCTSLQTIEICAPNLTSFSFAGQPIEKIINNSLQLKYMRMQGTYYSDMIQYARTKLHSIASNLQTLTLTSSKENFNTPVLHGKFFHLKRLSIYFFGNEFQSYDYFSLVSFLEACPALETFVLCAGKFDNVRQDTTPQDSIADSFHIRQIPEFQHGNLKTVSIRQFSSAKSLIELTCQIIENTPALRSLVLSTDLSSSYRCQEMYQDDIRKARCAVEAVERYIVGKVPASVKFKVL